MPLGFLIFVPAIIILYLLKQRAQKKEVSTVQIWMEAYENIEASRPWEKFKNNLLMYLQILLVMLLVFAMCFPYLKKGGDGYENIVLFLDNSGSMNGKYDEKHTKLDQAKSLAKEYVDGLKEGTNVTVVSCSGTANVEIANTTDKSQMEKAIEGIAVTDMEGNLTPGVSLIQSMVAQWSSYEVQAFTDSDYDLQRLKGNVVDVSASGVNGVVDYVSHTVKEDGSVEVLAKISNAGVGTYASDVNLYLGESMADIRQVELKEGESEILYFQPISALEADKAAKAGDYIRVQLNEKDGMAKDNEGVDFLVQDSVPKVLLVTEQNVFLEKALTSGRQIELIKANSLDNIDDSKEYDFIIYDGICPKELPAEGSVLLIRPGESLDGIAEPRKKKENIVLRMGESEITRYLTDFTFGCKEAVPYRVPEFAQSFILGGDNTYGYYGKQDGRVIGVIGFDLHDTELPLQTEFPILIQNMLNTFLDASLLPENHINPGESIRFNASEDTGDIQIVSPGQTKTVIKAEDAKKILSDTLEAGVYTVEYTQKGAKEQVCFSVDFPTSQSVLKEGISGTVNGVKSAGAVKRITGGKNLTPYVILGALAVLLAEWLWYIRRR